MFVLNGKVLKPGKPFKHQGFQYPGDWLEQSTATQRRKLGIVERGTPKRLAKNYDPKFYYSADNPRPVEEVRKGLVASIKGQAGSTLAQTDWYVARKAEVGTPIPATVSDHRAAVRAWSNSSEAALEACETTEELNVAWGSMEAAPTLDA